MKTVAMAITSVLILLLFCPETRACPIEQQEDRGAPATANPETDEQILESLRHDFEAILEDDPNVAQIREAERLLAETNGSDKWTNYMAAIRIVRQTRSKAAIPLLLRYMVVHAELPSAGADGEYINTITLLTGESLANPYRYVADRVTPMRQGVRKLTLEWWRPNREALTTSIGRMTGERLSRIMHDVLMNVREDSEFRDVSGSELQSAYSLYHALYYGTTTRGEFPVPPELHPRMLPLLLQKAGYRSGAAAEAKDPQRVPLEVVPLLAALRRNGQAENLDMIAADADQATTPRMICMLAMYAAGENIDFSVVESILKTERRLHHRLICILTFLKCDDPQLAANVLPPMLHDRNAEVRAAAVYSLGATRPQGGLEALTQLLDARPSGTDIATVLDSIAEYRSDQAKHTIAAFLEKSIAAGNQDDVYDAIGPFSDVTEERFYEAGAHSREYYVEQARKALAWWNQHLQQRQEAVAAEQVKMTQEVRQTFIDQATQYFEAQSLRTGESTPRAIAALLETPDEFRVTQEMFTDCADRVADTLSPSEQDRLILFGNVAALDRKGNCWTVVSPGDFGISLAGHLETDTLKLVFLWVVPEG